MPFSTTDLDQLAARGVSDQEATRQLRCLREGFTAVDLDRPATLGDGIETLHPAMIPLALEAWASAAADATIAKFVPASGAASRMFQFLLARLQEGGSLDLQADDPLAHFLQQAGEFAFAEEWRRAIEERGLPWPPTRIEAMQVLLSPSGLGLAQWPKGLIPFHRYEEGSRTAFAEHLYEATRLVADARQRCRVHFTVTPEARERIRSHLRTCQPPGFEFQLSDSLQEPSTDTLAVDLEGQPLRDRAGRLVFRPGGHGALLPNLAHYAQTSGCEVLLVKNIDNVAREEIEVENVEARRALIGTLLLRRSEARAWWTKVASEGSEEGILDGAEEFCRQKLYRNAPPSTDLRHRREWILAALDRPTRVCGVVRNEGEPGGGPFWVRDPQGSAHLQIVESSQVDPQDRGQLAILGAATHFNPVDLACAVRSFETGAPYDLERYVDPATGFISRKSKDGIEILALEHPGLWNGSMAHWNTIFVEVPASTFHPVKTVLDLLRPAHRGK